MTNVDEVEVKAAVGGGGPVPPGGGRTVGRSLGWVRDRPGWSALIILSAGLLTVGVAGSCSPSSSKGAPAHSGAAASRAAPGTVAGSAAGLSSSAGVPAPAASAGPSSAVPALPTRVVKTGSLSLQVPAGGLLTAMSTMSDESTGFGGFVASSTTNTATPGSTPSGDITLRVPVASFGTLLADVEKLGRATSVSASGQDVTAQYVDLQARIQSLEDARAQFEQILARAQSIGDILAVEQQISPLQTETEQLQGQLKVLDNESSYSTLSAHVVEAGPAGTTVHPAKPASGLARAWRQARHSFARGFDSIVAFSGGLAIFLIVVGVLAIVARVVWVLVRRRVV